jgi:ribosomal protein S27E
VSDLKAKIAYLQGLAEGLDLDKGTKEGKIISAIIDVLAEMSIAVDEMAQYQEELEKYIEAVDEDLGDLEDEVYGYEEGCSCHDHDEDYEDDEEGSFVEIECPKCHDIVRFEASILADDDVIEVTCPNCDEVVYVNDGEEQEDEE